MLVKFIVVDKKTIYDNYANIDDMPNITPHVCRYTYCSNMSRTRMNPKTLQYLKGIGTFRLQ